jgi:hypothetical protein
LIEKMPDQVHIQDYTPHEVGDESYDLRSDVVIVDKANIVSVEPTEPHGRQGFILHFAEAVEVTYSPEDKEPHTVSLTEAEVQTANITTDGETAVIAEDDPLVKASWNYFLIHGDGSHGVHNPSFTMEVLRASMDALEAPTN